MPSWTPRLDEFTRRWTRVLALLGLLGLLVQAGMTILDILLRAIFSAPIQGLSDLYELVVIFMVAASFPASLAGRNHITIRLLGKAISWRGREALEFFGHVLTLLVFVALAWQLVLHTRVLFGTGQTTWLLGLPMGPSWAVATALIILCTPVQAGVVAIQFMRLSGAAQPKSGEPGSIEGEAGAPADPDAYETRVI